MEVLGREKREKNTFEMLYLSPFLGKLHARSQPKKLLILSQDCLQIFSLASFTPESRNSCPRRACIVCSVYSTP